MTVITRPAGHFRVLLVDDSKLESSEYRDGLLSKCASKVDVEVCQGVNQAIELLESDSDWDFIVLDMMMAHDGTKIDRELTKDGKFSGVVLAKHIRETIGETPIALLSNCTFSEVKDACIQTESVVTNCIHWQKSAMSPTDLAGRLDSYFEEGKLKKTNSQSILQRIFGALLFQPNVGGVGVDVKELLK